MDSLSFDTLISEFIKNRAESLYLEAKPWYVDLKNDTEVIAEIVRACIALYNNNGGVLAIGFDKNCDALPHENEITNDIIKKKYCPDNLQPIIHKYSSGSIDVSISFREINDVIYPFICIPSGVRVPVYVKKSLDIRKFKFIEDKIFTRTSGANGKPSSSEPKKSDWDNLIRRCMENQEADIAGFIQRHFTNSQIIKFQSLFEDSIIPLNNIDAKNFLEEGYQYYKEKSSSMKILPEHASFQVAFKLPCEIELNSKTLETMKSHNPRFCGWPLWTVLTNTDNQDKHPKKRKNRYEAINISENNASIDYWCVTKRGCFYHYRALPDNINDRVCTEEKRGKLIDIVNIIEYISEAIGIGQAFAKAFCMNENVEDKLSFSFKLTKLKNRKILADRLLQESCSFLSTTGSCEEDEFVYSLDISINASFENIAQNVLEATVDLYSYFSTEANFEQNCIFEIALSFLKTKKRWK